MGKVKELSLVDQQKASEIKANADAEAAEKAKLEAELKVKADVEAKIKAAEELAIATAKVKAEAHALALQNKKEVKYKVHFGVQIPEMGQTFTKAELEENPEACAYLVEIGSPSVTEL